MNRITAVAATISSLAVLTATASELTAEERAANKTKNIAKLMQKAGGTLVRPGSRQGEVFYVNCQKTAPRAWIDESISYFTEQTKFKISYREGAFDFNAPKIEGNATLFVIEDPKLPALLVAPENRWALVNIAVIAREKRPAYFEARVKKQLSRGFAYLCGASDSQYPRCLTRGIVDEADLDKNANYYLPVDVLHRFRTYMEPLGVKPEMRVTYRIACQEGWAPAPTNDVQKAIWDKVHALPTNPIKIMPETKPVKE